MKVGKGVIQGDRLSPLLFNMCINSLIKCIEDERTRALGYHQGRQSIPKSEGDGLQIRKVRRYATRNFFIKRHFQRFEGTYKVIVQCA